jgi:hypothetical protein
LTLGLGSAAESPIKPFKKSIAMTFLKLAQLIKRAVWKMCSSFEPWDLKFFSWLIDNRFAMDCTTVSHAKARKIDTDVMISVP